MKHTEQLAKHVHDMYFGGNWTDVNIRDTLADVKWQEATTQIKDLNSIATLTYHIHYYLREVLKVLEGQPLTAKDKFSFEHPLISSETDWQQFLQTPYTTADNFAKSIARMDDGLLHTTFLDEKYGSYYGNLLGIIEHSHYHLGQLVLIKKLIRQS